MGLSWFILILSSTLSCFCKEIWTFGVGWLHEFILNLLSETFPNVSWHTCISMHLFHDILAFQCIWEIWALRNSFEVPRFAHFGACPYQLETGVRSDRYMFKVFWLPLWLPCFYAALAITFDEYLSSIKFLQQDEVGSGNCWCHQTECKWRNSVHFRVQSVSPLFWLHDFALGFWSVSGRSEDDLESHWIGISWSGYYTVKLRKLSDIFAQLFVTLLCGDEHCAGLLCSETSHWKDLLPWWIHWVVQSSSESSSPSATLFYTTMR